MKPKLLWIPFFSMQDKQTGQFLLEADQNITFFKGIQDYLLHSFNVSLIMPKSVRNTFIVNEVIQIPIPTNNIAQRYNFDYCMWEELLKTNQYDVIFNNNDGISRALKSIIEINKLKTKLVTYFHFLALPSLNMIPENITYFSHQIDAIKSSDLCICQTEKNLDALKIEIMNVRKDFSESDFNNICFYNFAFSYRDIELDNVRSVTREKNRIIFPNRLSSNNYSKHEEFIKAVNNLYNKRKDFEVVMTNPTGFIPNLELKKIVDPIVFPFGFVDKYSRSEYFELLRSSDYVCALFDEIHGGFAIREAMYNGCIPIIPFKNDYCNFRKRYYNDFNEFIYVTSDLSNLESVLDHYLDLNVKHEIRDKAKQILKEMESFEYNYKRMYNDIERILS